MPNQAKHQAVSQPQFIIKSDDGTIYYLTLSVWAYEPGATGNTDQTTAAAAIQKKFNDLVATQPNLTAVQMPDKDAQMYMAMIT